MLTLLYGTRGARDEIFSRIASDVGENRRAYLIVPDQKALLAENSLMNTLPKSAALLVDAVGFSRLSNLVSRRYGSLIYNYASESAKILTMYRTVKKLAGHLNVFDGELQSGTLEALCSLMDEFRACTVSAEDISDAAEKVTDDTLTKKLFDLSLIFAEYESLLHEKFAEQADDIDTLVELLSEHDFFEDSHIYIDSFISFTSQEFAVISNMLSRGKDVTVALPFNRRGVHMAECADTRKKLLSLCAKLSVKLEEKYTSAAVPEPIEFARDNLWDLASGETFDESTEGTLELVCCKSKADEVTLCLREVFLALQRGESYSDIAIIARNADSYAGIVDRMLSRCDIPFFFSRKKSVELMPLARLISSALSLYVYNFKESDVSAYIKTGLLGLNDDECDIFEEYINRWNISGRYRYLDGEDFTMSGHGFSTDETDADLLLGINNTKQKIALPLLRFCDSLDGAVTVKDFATAVYEYLTEMNIREKSSSADFTKYFGAEHTADAIRLWNITMDALDTLVDASGDENVTAADFCKLIKLLFASTDISEIPSSKDQIIIGNADTIRIDERKTVIILGAVEGVFPAPVSESPTLGESERDSLAKVGVSLSQNMALRSARELYHFTRAIDFATKKAVISYYITDLDGAKCEPSFAVARLRKLFSKLYFCNLSALAPIDTLYYATQAAELSGALGKENEEAVKAALLPRGIYTPKIQDASLLSNDSLSLSPDTAKAFFGERMYLSQSKLDTYTKCKLNYFMQHMLSLEDTDPFEFKANDTGTFVHSVLEKLIYKIQQSGKKIGDIEEDEIEMLATATAAEEVERIMRTQTVQSSRMLYFFDRTKRSILLIARALVNEFKNSKFEPFALEYRIGAGGHKPIMITLSDGASVSLNGIADRVDIYKGNGKVFIRIVDYKTGKKDFSEKDLQKGKNLQLLIYLFSLCEIADKEFFDAIGVNSTDDILPGAVTYFLIKSPRIKLDTKAPDDIEELAQNKLERIGFVFDSDTLAGILDRTAEKQLSKDLIKKDGEDIAALFDTVKSSIANIAENMRNGKIDTSETILGQKSPCNYCKYSHICRKENIAEEEEENDG
ncbi:MAG: PD-(D/E)XK nuclease family protein [Clostridia bacterium]|nr:PD-(D/E)XK nuclease family protein [Clostridia bacterium]